MPDGGQTKEQLRTRPEVYASGRVLAWKNRLQTLAKVTLLLTGFHISYTFCEKRLEHFWKVWYIIAILVRIEQACASGFVKYLFYILKGVIHYDDACKLFRYL